MSEEEKRIKHIEIITMGIGFIFKIYNRIFDYCELDLVIFESIRDFFKYKTYRFLRLLLMVCFISSSISVILLPEKLQFYGIIASFSFLVFYFLVDLRMFNQFNYSYIFYRKISFTCIMNWINLIYFFQKFIYRFYTFYLVFRIC